MDLDWVWKTFIIIAAGLLLLRISGRRSIAHMTVPHTVIMIMIGTLLIHPVKSKELWTTIAIGILLILALIIIEFIELKFIRIESIVSGKAISVIENGEINVKNFKKLRLTKAKLESLLRQVGVTTISDVQYATLEVNGRLGFMLKKEKQPATKEDIQNLIQLIQTGQIPMQTSELPDHKENMFIKVVNKDSHTPSPKKFD